MAERKTRHSAPRSARRRMCRAGTRTSSRRSTTRSSPSPTPTGTSSAGQRRRGRLQGLAQEHAVRRQLAAETAARRAMEHGMRQVEVFVKGPAPAASRRSARSRPPASSQGHHRRHADSAQRLPPAQEAPGLGERRWPDTPTRSAGLCRREGMKLFLKGERCFSRSAPSSVAARRPACTRQRRRKVSEYGLQLREKQKVAQDLRRPGAAVPQLLREGRAAQGHDRRKPAAPAGDAARQRRLSAWASRGRAPRRASSSATATSP